VSMDRLTAIGTVRAHGAQITGPLALVGATLTNARGLEVRAITYGGIVLSMRVPEDPVKRFPAVVRAADVLLAVTREAA